VVCARALEHSLGPIAGLLLGMAQRRGRLCLCGPPVCQVHEHYEEPDEDGGSSWTHEEAARVEEQQASLIGTAKGLVETKRQLDRERTALEADKAALDAQRAELARERTEGAHALEERAARHFSLDKARAEEFKKWGATLKLEHRKLEQEKREHAQKVRAEAERLTKRESQLDARATALDQIRQDHERAGLRLERLSTEIVAVHRMQNNQWLTERSRREAAVPVPVAGQAEQLAEEELADDGTMGAVQQVGGCPPPSTAVGGGDRDKSADVTDDNSGLPEVQNGGTADRTGVGLLATHKASASALAGATYVSQSASRSAAAEQSSSDEEFLSGAMFEQLHAAERGGAGADEAEASHEDARGSPSQGRGVGAAAAAESSELGPPPARTAPLRGGRGEFVGRDVVHVSPANTRQGANRGYTPFGGVGAAEGGARTHAHSSATV
jgi:hypothetical protein